MERAVVFHGEAGYFTAPGNFLEAFDNPLLRQIALHALCLRAMLRPPDNGSGTPQIRVAVFGHFGGMTAFTNVVKELLFAAFCPRAKLRGL